MSTTENTPLRDLVNSKEQRLLSDAQIEWLAARKCTNAAQFAALSGSTIAEASIGFGKTDKGSDVVIKQMMDKSDYVHDLLYPDADKTSASNGVAGNGHVKSGAKSTIRSTR